MSQKKLKVTLIKSPAHAIKKHRDSVRGLGLKKINQSVIREDTPQNRGMIKNIQYMVNVEELQS